MPVQLRGRHGICCTGNGAIWEDLAYRFALHGNVVGLMHDPIQDGLGDGDVGKPLRPAILWNLAGDEGGLHSIPIVEDLQETTARQTTLHGSAHPPVQVKRYPG